MCFPMLGRSSKEWLFFFWMGVISRSDMGEYEHGNRGWVGMNQMSLTHYHPSPGKKALPPRMLTYE